MLLTSETSPSPELLEFVWNEPLTCGRPAGAAGLLAEKGFNGRITGAGNWPGTVKLVEPGVFVIEIVDVLDWVGDDGPAGAPEPPGADEPPEVDEPPDVEEPPDGLDLSAYAMVGLALATPTPASTSTAATRVISRAYSVEPIALPSDGAEGRIRPCRKDAMVWATSWPE